MLLDKGDGGCCAICSFVVLGVGTVLLSRRCCFGGRSSPLSESEIARFILLCAKIENDPATSRVIEAV
jgi:hypothetical protein